MYVVARIGSEVIRLVTDAGRGGLLFARILGSLSAIRRSVRLIIQQMFVIGNGSVPLVLVTSIFTGAVAAVQAAYQFRGYVPMRFLGTVVAKSVVIELGPVLTALVVGARVGASIAAELGTMRVTEQIDALEMLAIDPVRYLAMPRFIAASIMLPVLTVFADVVAIMGGYVAALGTLDVTSKTYVDGLRMFFEAKDVYGGLIKAFVFGGIIAISGTINGFNTSGGAEGVGAAAMRAVVASSVMILIADYVLATVIFQVLFSS
jgi:phospholipid/cholesterol/gamma-HCH transport system permease protein